MDTRLPPEVTANCEVVPSPWLATYRYLLSGVRAIRVETTTQHYRAASPGRWGPAIRDQPPAHLGGADTSDHPATRSAGGGSESSTRSADWQDSGRSPN